MHEQKTRTVDPVCGMAVERNASIQVEHRGVTYRFCDAACAETFREDPERWVGDGADPGFVHDHQ